MFARKQERWQPAEAALTVLALEALNWHSGFYPRIGAIANNVRTATVRADNKAKVYLTKIFKIGLDVFGFME